MISNISVSLRPVTYSDIETLAQISADSFNDDRHTHVKRLGRKPFDMLSVTRSVLYQGLGRENCAYMKAVNSDAEETVGFCGWGFRVSNNDLVPRSDPGTPLERPDDKGSDIEAKDPVEEDSIDRLNDLEDETMKQWMNDFMPDTNTHFMYIQMLVVAPQARKQGVGNALVQWGIEVADRLGLFTWVQASEAAYGLLAKQGFEVVAELKLDLDEWAPRPPTHEDIENEGGEWGQYMLRSMKRLPKQQAVMHL
ncbi:acyl-CoA N-acyltransferase [Polyplosphaeria fusca]|uniref:Acyl-CoA N-acyltransferase n=1 Tax=Polyplosphaeria fusca TaxID=682080 RepID=A0A9P4QNK8_9PLEO|nr:acyl-CoA N-acyltransferase [Polyplosphaeria fusca]